MTFQKHDNGKRSYSLLPVQALGLFVDVLNFGAKKYGRGNWMKAKKAERYRYIDAMQRHFEAWRGGERNDQESGIHHLAHCGVNVLFLLSFDIGEADGK